MDILNTCLLVFWKCRDLGGGWGVGATGNAIIDGINSIFQDKKSNFYMTSDKFQSKVLSATADGASVNFEQCSGVLSQLKEDRPWMLKMRCINRRVELSV